MEPTGYYLAKQDFYQARRRAALEQILARLRGRSADLLAYDDVRRKLNIIEQGHTELREVPLDHIVGSVERYNDFTRSFFPKQDSDADRWARVMSATTETSGLPPVELFQIDNVYFVKDGHHRVSIARQLGSESIEAWVTRLSSNVPLNKELDPGELDRKARQSLFQERTRLNRLRPGADLELSEPAAYDDLEEHIAVHRYFMGLEQQREIPYHEAVVHWYDTVYRPVIEIIQNHGILRDFPNRTETDLYLWVSSHRVELEKSLGLEVGTEAAASDLSEGSSPKADRIVARVTRQVMDRLLPDEITTPVKPGEWREEHQPQPETESLFRAVLAPVSGTQDGWHAVEQAIVIAHREEGQIYGLHVVPSAARIESPEAQAVKSRFNQMCAKAGVQGRLTVVAGDVGREISARTRWADLLVVNLAYPPARKRLRLWRSGFRTLLRHAIGPVLAVPKATSPINRALLAYDGSPKAEEALFLATYLAARWHISLSVVCVPGSSSNQTPWLDRARVYLEEHGVQATYIRASGPVAPALLNTAEAQGSDLFIMGGYGRVPVVEIMLGSVVNHVLRDSRIPVLICR